MQHYSARELHDYLQTAKTLPILLDVREPWEYEKCRIDNSELIPMRQVPNALNRLDPDKEIVVICHHGIRSRMVASFLEQQGYSNVINLTGGLAAWAKEVDPAMETY
jgi:rhodanese-related sulfurtransferase